MIDLFKSGFEFTYKAASAALFGILLLLAFALTAAMGSDLFYGFYRYDYLLFFALLIQVLLLYTKLESWAEAKVIALFHLMAMVMEIFLTHPAIASWYYPQPAIFKIMTVPLLCYMGVVVKMVRALPKMKLEPMKALNDELRAIENEADRLMLELYGDIYSGQLDPLHMFLLKEFFEILEKAIDRCREAGVVAYEIVLKNS